MRFILVIILVLCSRSAFAQHEADSTQRKNGIAVLPVIYYTPETRWAFGVAGLYIYRPEIHNAKPTTATASAVYTQNKQISIELTTNAFSDDAALWHQGSFYYQKFPNSFFGIGNATPDSSEEKYSAEIIRINPILLTKLSDRLYGGVQVHYETWSLGTTETGKLLASGTIPGSRSTTVTGVGFVVNYDERDNLFAPLAGRYYQAGFLASPTALGSTFGFTRTKIDLREYFPLGRNHVLSAQWVLQTVTGTAPFRFLPQIGGQNVMRGYFEGRYRDNHMAAVQTEYRSPFYRRFGFALFAAAGDVASRLSGFRSGSVKFAYGAGIRLNVIPEEFIILRVDYGVGKNSSGVYVTFNEAI